jgi:hypothetical protein
MVESHMSHMWVPISLRGNCLVTGAGGVEEVEHEQEVHVPYYSSLLLSWHVWNTWRVFHSSCKGMYKEWGQVAWLIILTINYRSRYTINTLLYSKDKRLRRLLLKSTIQILPIQKYCIKKEADVGPVWRQLDCSALKLKRANWSEGAWQSTIKILPIHPYWIKSQANRVPIWLKLDCSVSKWMLVSASHSKFDWSNLVQQNHPIEPIHTGSNQRLMEGQSGYSLTVQYWNQSLSVHITPSLIGPTEYVQSTIQTLSSFNTGSDPGPMEGRYGCSWTVQYQNQSVSVWIAPSLIGLTKHGQSTIQIPPIHLYWIKLKANGGLIWLLLDCSVSTLNLISANRSTFDQSERAWPKHHTNPLHPSILDRIGGQRRSDLVTVGLFSIKIKACQCKSHQIWLVWPSMAKAPYKPYPSVHTGSNCRPV